ncbi:hypothetical protein EDB85DRAFT_1900973 [Lactarius pseudohatsudake]|nr:hypothetical protein EDB85DRAFT_1900973 [Lactarius pseudohatsudake]
MPENSVALFRLGYHSQWLSYAGWFPLLLGLMNTSRRRNKLGLPNWNGAISKRPKTRFDIRSYCHARGRYYYQVSQHAEYQDGTVINLHKATTLPLLPIISRICAYLSLSREILDIIYRLCRFPLAAPRGVGRAVARLLHYVFIFTVLVQFILSGVAGVTSHLASQVHTVARNTHSITLAVCALPVPFKNVFCAGISNGLLSPLNPSVDKSLSWHPFLINEDIHGPAVDFAIRKTTNATSANRLRTSKVIKLDISATRFFWRKLMSDLNSDGLK